jgi:hypothetical protein
MIRIAALRCYALIFLVLTLKEGLMREPMFEKLSRLPSVGLWIAITLLVAVLVTCLLGSTVELMVRPSEQAVWNLSERFFY